MTHSIHIRTLLVTTLVPAVLASVGRAQERHFPVLPSSVDVKTAPEPSRPPDPIVSRPAGVVEETSTPAQSESKARHHALDPKAPVSATRRVDHTRMYYDAPGDGSLWVRGATYKASFDEAGATYFPLFGGRQPRHQPMRLSPESVTRGELQLASNVTSTAVRLQDRVELERGSFVERYDFATKSVEQSFVFASLPGAGDLVIRIPIMAEGESVTVDSHTTGLEIESALGRVDYGRATAVDARGQTLSLPTQFVDGSITIRVDAAFLSTVTLPLVVDPLVNTFAIDNSTFSDYWCDVAYDASTQRWLAVYQETATAGDGDIYYEMLNSAGASMWGGYVNSNNADWSVPSCGNLNAAHQFLVACSVNATAGRSARGRTIEATISSIGPEFAISGNESGDKLNPDVGGDPYPSFPSYYCVAFERKLSNSDHDVFVRLVDSNSGLVGPGTIYLSNSGGTVDEQPSVSKSDGGNNWTIAWHRFNNNNSADIWAGRISYNGTVVNNPFQLTSGSFDLVPCVSSPQTGTDRVMVTFQRWYGSENDVQVLVQDGTTTIASVDLNTLETTGLHARDQTYPVCDCDGQHFLVSYAEEHATSIFDYDVYADDLYLSGSTLGISQQHIGLGVFGGISESQCHLASAQGSGGPNRDYMVAWTRSTTSTNFDVIGALFSGGDGGTYSAFCAGDGSGAACPCGNFGTSGHGCANSVNAGGAQLFAGGEASTTSDSLVLDCDSLPATASCLFFQGTVQGAGAAFGDGLRCAAGTTIRLGAHVASGGFSYYPHLGDQPVWVKGGVAIDGETRTYQVWYRNAGAFCTPSTFNLSNGVRVVWAR